MASAVEEGPMVSALPNGATKKPKMTKNQMRRAKRKESKAKDHLTRETSAVAESTPDEQDVSLLIAV